MQNYDNKKAIANTLTLLIIAGLAALATYLVRYQPTDEELFRNALYNQITQRDIQETYFATNQVTEFNATIQSDISNPGRPYTRGTYDVSNSTGQAIVNEFASDTQTTAISVSDFSVGVGEVNQDVLNQWFYIRDNGENVGDDTGAFAYVDFINSPFGELPSGRVDESIRSELFATLLDAYDISNAERAELNGAPAVRYEISIDQQKLVDANGIIADFYGITNPYDGSPESFTYDQFVVWVGENSHEIEQLDLIQFGQASTVTIDYPIVLPDIPAQEISYEEFAENLFNQSAAQPQPDA